LVLFLAASAPHRVHHLFDHLQKAPNDGDHAHGAHSLVGHHLHAHSADPSQAGDTHDDHNHDGAAQTICLLQSAAQHSHLSTAQPVSVIFLKVEFKERLERFSLLLLPFNPSPFSQRAPPTI
jgi:hypothetical protein